MSRWFKANPDGFKSMVHGPGIIVSTFNPEDMTLDAKNILYLTKGGNALNITRELEDMGAELDNIHEGTMQLQRPKPYQVSGSTTVMTFTPEAIMAGLGSASAEVFKSTGKKITLRNEILEKDFLDFWVICDYSEFNGEKNGGMLAYHIKNAISTDGFNPTHAKDADGEFTFNYKAFYDMNDIDTVPIEIYVLAGTAEPEPAMAASTASEPAPTKKGE